MNVGKSSTDLKWTGRSSNIIPDHSLEISGIKGRDCGVDNKSIRLTWGRLGVLIPVETHFTR